MTELDGPHARVLAVLREDAAAGGIDLIRRVCRTCVRLLPVDGAAVTVVAHVGQRELVYATDTVSTTLADLQFALGEGPSFEAYTGGNPVLVPDLGAALPSAWPIFAVEATAQPVAALFTFPVHIGPIPIATLDAHRAAPGPLSTSDVVTARQLAGTAALALSGLSANLGRWLDGDGRSMSGAGMRHRQVSQATGMVMGMLNLSPTAALARIRAYAFACGRSLLEVAADIVSRQLDPSEVADHGPW
jgi:hypothetical protein